VTLDTSADRRNTAAFDLIVHDERPNALDWVITISQVPSAEGDATSVVSRFLRRTEAIGSPLARADQMPHGTRLSVGQPLDRDTPVIRAERGAGLGVHWIRFAVTGHPNLSTASLVITLATAP
jgi:hypothetical protein